jgi:hypothetical protein
VSHKAPKIRPKNTKTIRKEWPKVRLYVKGGNKYYRVDLRRKHYLGPQAKDFNDRAKALKYAAEIAERVAKLGVNSLTVVNDPRVKPWTDECSVYGHTVEDAISTAIGVWRKQKEAQESPFVTELLSVWVLDKIEGVKKLRPKSIKSIRTMAEMFKTDFGIFLKQQNQTIRPGGGGLVGYGNLLMTLLDE